MSVNASFCRPHTAAPVPVVIIGGGVVGGLCALLLAEAGIQPVVLDAAPPLHPRLLAQRDARVLALNAATIGLLKHVQVWQHIERRADYYGMQVWSHNGYGALEFGSAAHSPAVPTPDRLGSMVEPGVLGLALQQQLEKQLSDYHTGVQVTGIEAFTGYWQITLSTGQQYQTALLIGADGSQSLVRQAAGIGVAELDYHQVALSCAIYTEQPHQHIARQVFLPTGPLAFLPMYAISPPTCSAADPDAHWHSVVWTLPEQDAMALSQLNDADFLAAITRASGHMRGAVLQVQSRAAFPLKARQAERYVLPQLALIGDAAHVVHPLAGQGVNLGCLDAAVLADCLLRDHARGIWAHWQTLNRYEIKRRQDNSIHMHGFSMLNWLHGTSWRPVQWLASEGMHQVGQQPWLLDIFSAHASGKPAIQDTRYAQYI